jgi:arylsulfatase A-like enzyme
MIGPVRGALLIGLAAFAALAGTACGDSRPDIVLVSFDSLRRDHVGAYGWKLPGPSPTPRLDAVAARARVFEGALTPMPATAPALATVLTGLPPRAHGVLREGDSVAEELAAARALPRRLVAAGYRAGGFVGSAGFGPAALGLGGFDPFDSERKALRSGSEVVAAALGWLDRIARGERRPIFLWLHLADARAPYGDAAEKAAQIPFDPKGYGWVDRRLYARKDARIARTGQYATGVREADAAFGQLLDGLAARGLDPLLLVAADHGEFMAEHLDRLGFAFSHAPVLGPQVLFVPLVVAGPEIEPARVAGAASLGDLYTTILESAGAGDPTAAEEGRIDLRSDPPPGRLVAAARRLLRGKGGKAQDAAVKRQLAARAIAVSDGSALLLVGEDGKPADPKATPPEPLAAAAATALAEQLAGERAFRQAGGAPPARPAVGARGTGAR